MWRQEYGRQCVKGGIQEYNHKVGGGRPARATRRSRSVLRAADPAVALGAQHPHIRQCAIELVKVQPIPDDKLVLHLEAKVVWLERDFPPRRLAEQRHELAGGGAGVAVVLQQRGGGAPRVDNVLRLWGWWGGGDGGQGRAGERRQGVRRGGAEGWGRLL